MTEDVEFMTKTKFSKMIESTVREKKLSHMDAILHLCEQHDIEPETVRSTCPMSSKRSWKSKQ